MLKIFIRHFVDSHKNLYFWIQTRNINVNINKIDIHIDLFELLYVRRGRYHFTAYFRSLFLFLWPFVVSSTV